MRGGDEWTPALFAVLLGLRGEGTLRPRRQLPLARGTTALVPFGAGPLSCTAPLEAIRCLPPDPASPEGAW